MSTENDKPQTQSVNVHGTDAHGSMGEQPEPTQQGIPDYLVAEGKRQADHGATFYDTKLSECSRDELYGAIVAAWYETQLLRTELGQLQEKLQGASDGQE